MVGKRGALIVALSMMAVALSGCSAVGFGGGGTNSIVEAPVWQAGYSWAANTEYNVTWTESFDGETESDWWDGEGTWISQVVNTTTDFDGTPVYISVIKIDDWEEVMAHRKADLLPIWLNYNFRYCAGDACDAELEFEPFFDIEDEPIYLDFPLSVGKSWSGTFSEDEGFAEIVIDHEARVASAKTYNSEYLGDVEVLEIKRSVKLANANEVLEALAEEMHDEDGVTVHEIRGSFGSTITQYYSPVYQNVIWAEERFESEFYLDIEEDGERHVLEESDVGFDRFEVTGAKLSPQPEMNSQQIAGMLSGQVGIEDPSGNTVDEEVPILYTVSIDALVDEVNVADGEQLSFQATIDGDFNDAHELVWRATDYGGNQVSEGTGPSFIFAPDAPGPLQITLESQAAGEVVALDTAGAAGHFIKSLTIECGVAEVAGNGVPTDCQEQIIPVRQGIESLDITATTASPADATNVGTIRLTDVRDEDYDAGNYGDAKHIFLDEFGGMALGPSGWTLDWYQNAGVAEQSVQMDVELIFSTEIEVQMASMSVSSGAERMQSPWHGIWAPGFAGPNNLLG